MDEADEILAQASKAFSSENFELALSLIEPLVEKENPSAIGMLGFAYQLGAGVEMNGLKAVSLMEKAIALGDGVAAHNLGTIYVTGLPGVEANATKAKECYRLAKARGAQFAEDEWYE